MSKPKNIVLKLGGSAVTKKKDEAVRKELLQGLGLSPHGKLDIKKFISDMGKFFRWELLDNLGPQLAKIYQNLGKKGNLTIIHGAGPFGHSVVSHFRDLEKEIRDYKGWPLTILSVTLQNQMIVGWLQEYGIPAVSIPPHAIYLGTEASSPDAITFQDAKSDMSIVHNLLHRGYVPVFFGDMIIDTTGEFRVLSGDTLLPILVRELGNVDLVIAGAVYGEKTDREDGIYTLDPAEYKEATLIRQIMVPKGDTPSFILEDGRILSLEDFKYEIQHIKSLYDGKHAKSDDVTGEIEFKLHELILCARNGVPGYIVDIKRIADILIDNKEIGTKIIPEIVK